MPNLQWDLEKRETTRKEEVQETHEIKTPSRIQEVIIYIMISIYSCILIIQNTVVQYANSTIETAQELVTTTRDISHTCWIRIQKEIQAKGKHPHAQRENLKNQWYTACNSYSKKTTTQ